MKALFAGGGTGGHIFPGIALVEVLKRRRGVEFLFVGTRHGMDSDIMDRLSIPYRSLDLSGFKGKGIFGKVSSLIRALVAIIPSIKMIRDFDPSWIIGLGGYSSLPVVFAGFLMRRNTAILEQNILPGLTNRVLAPFVSYVFVSFDESLRYLPKGKTIHVGNPVRKGILKANTGKRDRFTILVCGGSQGSKGLNSLVLESLDFLVELIDEMVFIHQAGRDDLTGVEKGYRDRGFDAEVVEFIEDMGDAYARSHLVVCRGGATTIAELTALGRASIIVPFPHAADNHQEVNAYYLEKRGAARVIKERRDNGRLLADMIKDLFKNPSKLQDMEKKARSLGRPDAAVRIVDICFSNVS